jgi:hypothetical protein
MVYSGGASLPDGNNADRKYGQSPRWHDSLENRSRLPPVMARERGRNIVTLMGSAALCERARHKKAVAH